MLESGVRKDVHGRGTVCGCIACDNVQFIVCVLTGLPQTSLPCAPCVQPTLTHRGTNCVVQLCLRNTHCPPSTLWYSRAHIPEEMTCQVGYERRRSSGSVFSCPAVYLRPPFRTGSSWQEWCPTPGLDTPILIYLEDISC